MHPQKFSICVEEEAVEVILRVCFFLKQGYLPFYGNILPNKFTNQNRFFFGFKHVMKGSINVMNLKEYAKISIEIL